MLKLVYQDIYLGGAETFLLRVGRYFISKNIQVVLYCEYIYSDEIKLEYEQAGIEVNTSTNAPVEAYKNNKHGDIFLTISLFTYIECLYQNKKDNKLFYYVVHPYNPLHVTKSLFINKYTFKKYRDILVKAISSGHMFFMDEINVDEFCKFYNIKDDKSCNIVYLPMKINKLNNKSIIKKAYDKKNQLCFLTIARSEFPFKGYIRGLIKWYCEASRKSSNIKLVIISSGKSVSKLREWVKRAEDNGVDTIELYENVPPAKLKGYYNQAICYIGQGTTLLDACNYGVPALPVEGYTFDLKSKGFFDKVNGCLGVPFGIGENANRYLEDIIKMNDDEYINLIKNCYMVFKEKYDISNFYKYIMEDRKKSKIKIPRQIMLENYIRRFIRNLKYKV